MCKMSLGEVFKCERKGLENVKGIYAIKENSVIRYRVGNYIVYR